MSIFFMNNVYSRNASCTSNNLSFYDDFKLLGQIQYYWEQKKLVQKVFNQCFFQSNNKDIIRTS